MRTNADKHKCQYFNQRFEKLFWCNVVTTEKSIRGNIFYIMLVSGPFKWTFKGHLFKYMKIVKNNVMWTSTLLQDKQCHWCKAHETKLLIRRQSLKISFSPADLSVQFEWNQRHRYATRHCLKIAHVFKLQNSLPVGGNVINLPRELLLISRAAKWQAANCGSVT